MRNLISIIAILLLIRCANQTSPTGGPQDKKPPVLLESTPKNNEKNFKAKTFELSFDEPVKLKNANEEVLITPSLGKKSKIVAKKNKVLITPEKPLEDSTTYTIDFRDAVQDLNEGNPAYNLRLAFSTGPEIDSLQIFGSVNELFKEQIPEKITVALYQQDTFNIFNHTPVYFTRTDAKGRFSITNLKAGKYYIYAFEDKSRNLKVDSKSEKFGFQTQQIILDAKKQDSIKIWLTRVDARPLKITSIRNTDRQSKIKFNKAIDSINVTAKDYELSYQYANTQEEILIFNPPKKDSVQIKIVAIDSVGNKLDTVSYIEINNTKLPKEKFTIQLNEPVYNIEKQQATIEGTFSKPLDGFTLDSLFIQLDTTQFVTIDKKDISIDPVKHKIKITKTFTPLISKDEKSKAPQPIFIAGKGSFISIEGDTSKSVISNIKILKEDEMGALSIKVSTSIPNYILELMNSKGTVIKKLKNPKNHVFKNLVPEEYKIRVIIDTNNNGKWDIGNFEKKVEPEPVFLYKTIDKKYSTPVRANWEVGPLNIKF
jgi:uncharacterized protein (DUF2141 family)